MGKRKLNNNIEQNEKISEVKQNNISFDEEEYYSRLSDVDEEKARQKDDDNLRAENLKDRLQDGENIRVDSKKIILDIIGEDKISDDDLERVWGELNEEQLKNLNMNKNLILDIIGDDRIDARNLWINGTEVSELTEEDLKKVKENKEIILEITGAEEICISDLTDLSKLTREELEKIKENKEIILEITGAEEICISDLTGLSKLTREELEKIKENKELIFDIIGEERISVRDLIFYGGYLSSLTKKELKKFRENKNLIGEIIGTVKINVSDLGVWLSKLTREELEKIKENKELMSEIIGNEIVDISDLEILSRLTREELEKIKENKELILEVAGVEEIYIRNLTYLTDLTKEELEKIKENKELILEITGAEEIYVSDLTDLSKLTREELEKIKENKELIFDIIGKEKISVGDFAQNGKRLSELTRQDLENIKIICSRNRKKGYIYDISTIVKMNKVIRNASMVRLRDYMGRKCAYLEKNKLIGDFEFDELFGGSGKYGKGEIYQGDIKCCYLYTTYELLKKMNYFETLVKTNLKKLDNVDGWCVRLPMGQIDGLWIPVHKNEIDKTFDILDEQDGLREGVSVNSDSSLGFKIMEIAYMKKRLIDFDSEEFFDTGDVALTGEKIHYLEGGQVLDVLKTLIGEDKVDEWVLVDENIVFDNFFSQGLMVNLGVKYEKIDNEVQCKINGRVTSQVLVEDVKIINSHKNISLENDERISNIHKGDSILKSGIVRSKDNILELVDTDGVLPDLVDDNGVRKVVFYRDHMYSLERCYVDKNTGEKRVQVVNPRYTCIKFDISFEEGKKIFDRRVSYVDIDKLFR